MKCIAQNDVDAIFGAVGFKALEASASQRAPLHLNENLAQRQKRIGAQPPEASSLTQFVNAINLWLPDKSNRLLWIEFQETAPHDIGGLASAARRGAGEARSIYDAPGHLFEPLNYNQQDPLELSDDQAREISLLLGLLCLVICGGWDAWLISDATTDRIEFWEGNIFFHSSDAAKIKSADALFSKFKCSREPA